MQAAVDPQTILITSRGTARLCVDGAETAKIGMPVYVESVGSFSLAPTSAHAKLMGIIEAVFEDTSLALLNLRAYDDLRPFRADGYLQETERR
jgi:hypothetical protein